MILPGASRTISRRIKLITAFLIFMFLVFATNLEQPEISPPPPSDSLNASKLALLIESRPLPILAPLVLHFISVVPPDWPFRFMGSPSSLAAINSSFAIRQQVLEGKLDLGPIPVDMSTQGQEMISRFLTTPWLYETALQPAEWLLVFQTDSVICANSKYNLDDFLEYDWVGAPWDPGSTWGGNGGLSLRRVSRIVDVLRSEERAHDSEPEDVWLTERLARLPEANLANGSVSLAFSGELHSGLPERTSRNSTLGAGEHVAGIDDWREGFYEPMGYHTGGGGIWLHTPIWGTPELRQHIWSYCPEVKLTLDMDVARYVPGNCGAHW